MKLHLGCGPCYIPEFTHVDVVPFEHVDIVSSIDNLGMVADGSAELVYACHVLEHFPRKRTLPVLKEWRRVLRPGGMLRLSVPDFGVCARLYVEEQASLADVIGPLVGGQTYLYNFHYNIFDEPSLTALLEEAGFVDVQRWDWRTTEHAEATKNRISL